jgi:RNA polymerase sigma-54 factor
MEATFAMMAMSPRLAIRQTQTLVMTPQLMQAIKLLQMSSLDLSVYVEAELEKNPLLEWHDTGDHWATGVSRSGSVGDEYANIEAYVAARPTLTDHLADQMVLAFAEPTARLIARYLIDNIDEAGYLQLDIETAAEHFDVDRARVSDILSIMQGFDPPGVFARDLSECLSLQLKERDRLDPAMQALITNIELLGRREFKALKQICAIDDEDLADMFAEIRALDPKPGLRFSTEAIHPVVPDVVVRPGPAGDWLIELNSETLPKILVNRTYHARISATMRGSKEIAYLSDCLQTAKWLVKCLDQRARTILKVSAEIVRQQDSFFTHGVQHLRPLNLKTVANAIDLHESTVSRVTSNKFMATPRGIFELKYFFTAAISARDGGAAHGAEAVRHRIRQLIDHETVASAVLSDDAIVRALQTSGIDIARRTVAKYREAMRIPSSVQRRRNIATPLPR